MMGMYEARAIFAAIDCELNEDFHRLNSNQVSRLLMEADQRKYRKPRNANGSRARMFFAYVQRRAHRTA